MSSPEQFLDQTVEQWVRQAFDTGRLELDPHSQCRVCRDPVIMGLTNKMIARGFTNVDILDTLEAHNRKLESDGDPPVTRESLRNHRANHFDVQSPAGAIYRRILEKRAADFGQDVHDGVGTILNAVSYYETMMSKGYETLISPDTAVSYQDGAAAAMKLHEIARRDEDAYDRARTLAEMGRIIEVVRSFVPPEKWPQLQAALRPDDAVGTVAAPAPQRVDSVRMVGIDDSDDERN